jgi:large subunit ribosomal protein L31e
MAPAKQQERKRSAIKEVVTREYTVNVHKRIHGAGRKFRAAKAIKAIRSFALKEMGTQDVRIDADLNKQVWVNGSANPPKRIRVRLSRKRNDDEESAHKLYTLVSFVPVDTYKNLQTKNVESDE